MTTSTRWLAPALAALCLLGGCATRFDLQGHRGARGLAPENTLAAFGKALDIGVSTLELDVGITRDGVVVISHDRYLNPDITRRGDGQFLNERGPVIATVNFADLQGYDVGRIKPGSAYARAFATQLGVDGERIPTLRALFDLVAKRGASAVRFNIETKISPLVPEEAVAAEPFVRALIAEIRGAGLAARATIQSFDWRTLLIAQKEAPEIVTVFLTSQQGAGDTVQVGKPGASPWLAGFDVDDHGGSTPRTVKAAGGTVWSPNFKDVTAALVNEAHTLGLKIIPWTVNDEADMARLLDWQVDGLISDYPDRLRALLERRGMTVPARYPAR
ncbi:MAG: glycerophosphodiester phosphodiesterase [Burkholderiales bacterium]|nr:glycerophosphodiester phosphodiesterase [Burkholderiales bacterium]